jgi:hypothetical protein
MTQITSTATRLTPQYLYLREPFAVSVSETQAGTGLTLTARFAETRDGSPDAINAALGSTTITASGGSYAFAITSANLVTHLSAFINRVVFFHLFDNGGTFREVYAFRVTDTDPDLLTPPVGGV